MARNLLGQIIDDMRFTQKMKSDNRRNTRWKCECIYCEAEKVINMANIRDRVGTHCTICSNKKGSITKQEEADIVTAYLDTLPVKEIAYLYSVSLRTLYNVLHRNNIKLTRKTFAED